MCTAKSKLLILKVGIQCSSTIISTTGKTSSLMLTWGKSFPKKLSVQLLTSLHPRFDSLSTAGATLSSFPSWAQAPSKLSPTVGVNISCFPAISTGGWTASSNYNKRETFCGGGKGRKKSVHDILTTPQIYCIQHSVQGTLSQWMTITSLHVWQLSSLGVQHLRTKDEGKSE